MAPDIFYTEVPLTPFAMIKRDDLKEDGWEAHKSTSPQTAIGACVRAIGCLTSPAPEGFGRNLPPGRTEEHFNSAAVERWKANAKAFGRWAYEEANLAWKATPDGPAWKPFSSTQREAIHGLPKFFTGSRLSEGVLTPNHWRVRARMIAKCWHADAAQEVATAV